MTVEVFYFPLFSPPPPAPPLSLPSLLDRIRRKAVSFARLFFFFVVFFAKTAAGRKRAYQSPSPCDWRPQSHTLLGIKIASLGWYVCSPWLLYSLAQCFHCVRQWSTICFQGGGTQQSAPAGGFSFPWHPTNEGLYAFTAGGCSSTAFLPGTLILQHACCPLGSKSVQRAPSSPLPAAANPSGSYHSLIPIHSKVWAWM